LADLQARAERSFAAVRAAVGSLEAGGHLREVTRFWIVNGFAAFADAAACARLAAMEEVGFVYRQRGPSGLVQGRAGAGGRGRRATAGRGELAGTLAKRDALVEGPFSADGLDVPWNLKKVRADAAWRDHGATGAGVVVAVLDTGLLPLPPLVPALWRNRGETLDGRDNDGNGYVDDVFGYDFAADSPECLGDGERPHGTMCASIIAGRPHGTPRTVTGVAPRASLMVLRGGGQLAAYEYAARHGADVLSMSYMWIDEELGHYRGVYRTAHEHLAALGVLSLGGAGNFGRSHPANRQIAVPKDIPCVLAVAGIGADGTRPAFGSEGPVLWSGVRFYDDHPASAPLRKPDLTACNSDIPVWGRLAFPNARILQDLGNGTGLITGPRGNSFAGPHVAGVAALVWSVEPELTAFELAELLTGTAQDLGPEGPDTTYGAGLVQADAALRAARARRR
ncbi:MAG: S8 family serine peptidase, partial [Planctomycetes bacterium]|nr:S8 family serine peptidase [Planctomycetota bacterium]